MYSLYDRALTCNCEWHSELNVQTMICVPESMQFITEPFFFAGLPCLVLNLHCLCNLRSLKHHGGGFKSSFRAPCCASWCGSWSLLLTWLLSDGQCSRSSWHTSSCPRSAACSNDKQHYTSRQWVHYNIDSVEQIFQVAKDVFVLYVKGRHHHHHRATDLLCIAGGDWQHPDDHSKQLDGVAWPHLVSEVKHTHPSQEDTHIRQDDHCGFRSAATGHKNKQGMTKLKTWAESMQAE